MKLLLRLESLRLKYAVFKIFQHLIRQMSEEVNLY